MSTAIRAPWVDSMRFEVVVLLRWAAYITVMRTIITAASTVRVIISSTSVKPRALARRPLTRTSWVRLPCMDLSPQVDGGLHRPRPHEVPGDGDGDLLQVVERGGQGGHLVVPMPLPGGPEIHGRRSRRVAAVSERRVGPRQPVELLQLLVRVVAPGRHHAVRRLSARAGREHLGDRQDPQREHDQCDHQLDERGASFVGRVTGRGEIHDGYLVRMRPDSWMLTVSR